MENEKNNRIRFDSETAKWFEHHPDAQTTVTKCVKCGLFYKPDLGHRCKAEEKEEREKHAIHIVVGGTWAEIHEALGISEERGFEKVLERLKELKNLLCCSCILESSIDELIYLFKHLEIFSFYGSSNMVYADDCSGFCQKVQQNNFAEKIDTIHKAWLQMLYDLAEDIDELFRYSFTNESEAVIFLKNLLMFLTYTKITEDKEVLKYFGQ